MGGGPESRWEGRVYGLDSARNPPNRPDDGRMRPKRVELMKHQ